MLGTLAEDLEVILSGGIDEVHVEFSAEYDDLPVLVQKPDVPCKAGKYPVDTGCWPGHG